MCTPTAVNQPCTLLSTLVPACSYFLPTLLEWGSSKEQLTKCRVLPAWGAWRSACAHGASCTQPGAPVPCQLSCGRGVENLQETRGAEAAPFLAVWRFKRCKGMAALFSGDPTLPDVPPTARHMFQMRGLCRPLNSRKLEQLLFPRQLAN